MNTVLVTGASGFIGTHTIQPLLEKNFIVHAICYHRSPTLEHQRLTWHCLDLYHEESTNTLLEKIKPTHLLHLAWCAKPEDYRESEENLVWLKCSIQLLKHFAQVGGKRAVCVGSCFEKPFLEPGKTFDIQATLYGQSKYDFFLQSEEIAKQFNISLAWARIFSLFGAYEHANRLVPAAILHYLKQKKFTLWDPHAERDFLFVNDVADALVTLLETAVVGAVDIGSGKAIAIRELISMIATKFNAPPLTWDSQKNKTKDIMIADLTRLKDEVGWESQYSLETALDQTIAWWREQF